MPGRYFEFLAYSSEWRLNVLKFVRGFNSYVPKLVTSYSEILFIPSIQFYTRVNKLISFQLLLKYSEILIYFNLFFQR